MPPPGGRWGGGGGLTALHRVLGPAHARLRGSSSETPPYLWSRGPLTGRFCRPPPVRTAAVAPPHSGVPNPAHAASEVLRNAQMNGFSVRGEPLVCPDRRQSNGFAHLLIARRRGPTSHPGARRGDTSAKPKELGRTLPCTIFSEFRHVPIVESQSLATAGTCSSPAFLQGPTPRRVGRGTPPPPPYCPGAGGGGGLQPPNAVRGLERPGGTLRPPAPGLRPPSVAPGAGPSDRCSDPSPNPMPPPPPTNRRQRRRGPVSSALSFTPPMSDAVTLKGRCNAARSCPLIPHEGLPGPPRPVWGPVRPLRSTRALNTTAHPLSVPVLC